MLLVLVVVVALKEEKVILLKVVKRALPQLVQKLSLMQTQSSATSASSE